MTSAPKAFLGADIFDGTARHRGQALIVDGDRISGIVPSEQIPEQAHLVQFDGGILSPGFVDLQVNGGGGVMFNDDQSVTTLRTMSEAHASLGTTAILPTLITDTADRTERAIEAVVAALEEAVPGIIGLHLEGPHLSQTRNGAHDPTLIRPMEEADIERLLDAAHRLPFLKTTVAPEAVTPNQITRLTDAGILVSLGHSDADFDTCQISAQAGARCVTHLFNAMSQLGNREPGLVGAALVLGTLSAGLIADGVHVHPQSVKAALAAKVGPGSIFLVSDSMAVAGTKIDEFELNGRPISRRNGRLTLADGTLAGADLDLTTAVANIVRWGAATTEQAIAMATSIPAALHSGMGLVGRLVEGGPADFIHLDEADFSISEIWRAGKVLPRSK